MERIMRAMVFAMCVSAAPAAAFQGLDVPEQRTFGEKIPKKQKTGRDADLEFEISGTIEIEKSSLVICSEGAAAGGDLEKALDACAAAIDEAPDDGDAYYYRGVILSQLGRSAEAEGDFTSAINLKANRLAESYYWRGVSREAQRKLRDAAGDFRRASELKPEWSAARRKVEEYYWAYQ